MSAITKVWRYISIYGIGRTLFKVAARSPASFPLAILPRSKQDIGIIGCGQFGVASLGYFLTRRFGRRIRSVFDVDPAVASKGAKILGAQTASDSAATLIADDQIEYLYIASNHASHTDYAISGLEAGKTVYTEKPIAVTYDQLARLSTAARKASKPIYAGYNRPFSRAIRTLAAQVGPKPAGGVSLSCFVSGHVIDEDHWYRDEAEGTRICGNAGHWIDLFCHILSWRGLPETFRLQLLQADAAEPDDNFALSIATDQGDIFTLMLTARSEPFEGINETINFQQGETICKIDDFRRMTVWRGKTLRRWRFWPKDAGHKLSALQPFAKGPRRSWNEVELSALLVLHVTDMVRQGQTTSEIRLREASEALISKASLQ